MPISNVAELIQRSADANAALMRGDIEKYRALVPVTDDFTLMSPFGGTPTRGADMTSERWEATGRFFRNGTLEQEVVQTYASADMIVLAIIERARVDVGGLPLQDWPLRVTLVYRREGTECCWRIGMPTHSSRASASSRRRRSRGINTGSLSPGL